MSHTAARAKKTILDFLKDGAAGLNVELSNIESRDSVTLKRVTEDGWFGANVSPEVLDEYFEPQAPYPHGVVYLDRQDNRHCEKFRYFAGDLRVKVEIRHSVEGPPQLAALEDDLDRYVEAVLNVLQSSLRNWGAGGSGLNYGGTFEVAYTPVLAGGLGFLQVAAITLHLRQYTS